MLVRTTISLEQVYIEQLKDFIEKYNYRSLSQVINKAVESFLEEQAKQKQLKQMEEDYRSYAQSFSHEDFSEMETASLSDLKTKS